MTPLRVADDVVRAGVLPQVRLLISESEATLGRSWDMHAPARAIRRGFVCTGWSGAWEGVESPGSTPVMASRSPLHAQAMGRCPEGPREVAREACGYESSRARGAGGS